MFIFKDNNIIDTTNDQIVNEGERFISAKDIAFSSIDEIIDNVSAKIKLYNEIINENLVSQYTAMHDEKKLERDQIENDFANFDLGATESLSKVEQIKAKLKFSGFETKIKVLSFEIDNLRKKEEAELKQMALTNSTKKDSYRTSLEELVLSSEYIIETNLKGEKIDVQSALTNDLNALANIPLRNIASMPLDSSLDKSYDKKIKQLIDEKHNFFRSFESVHTKLPNISNEWQEVKDYANIYFDEFSILSNLTDEIVSIFMERKSYNDATKRKNEEDSLYIEREDSKARLINIDNILNELIREIIREKLDSRNLIIPDFLIGCNFFA